MSALDLGAALAVIPTLTSVVGGLRELHGFLREFREGSERNTQLARMLWLEAQQNLLVLDALLLEEREQVASNHPGFVRAAKGLSTSSHVLAALSFSRSNDEIEQAKTDAEERDAGLAERHAWARTSVLLECADGQLEALTLADLDPETRTDIMKLRERRPATIAQAASVVATRVGALQALAAIAEDCEPVLRNIRYATRLRTVRAYEHAVRRRLSAHPALVELLPLSEVEG